MVYGVVDVVIVKEDIGVVNGSCMVVNGGNQLSSCLGFCGIEDFGGGFKVSFKMEYCFDVDMGVLEDFMWKGEFILSFLGGFGEFKFGCSLMIYDEVCGLLVSSSVFDLVFMFFFNGVFGLGGDYSSCFNNKIIYVLLFMGNFYGGVEYVLDEDFDVKIDMIGVKLGYKSGLLNLVMGLQQEKGKENDYLMVVVVYDFGVVSVLGGYNVCNGNVVLGDDN